MEDTQFDQFARTIAGLTSRRGLLAIAASVPLVGGVLSEADAKRRQKRDRKDRNLKHDHDDLQDEKKKKKKNFLNQGATAGACVPITCVPDARSMTCAGTCGAVHNNCGQVVDCGPCTCTPACDTCERCVGNTCEICDPCCDGFCCDRANAICNAITGSCCVPAATAETCANKCGTVTNNCGIDVDCGGCANPTPICAANVCAACSGTNPCPSGQVCCDGSCLTGVCCVTADCAPGGDGCEDLQCFCGGGNACSGATPDCCGSPGSCTNTDTDSSNCGTCGTTCSGATPSCFNGACVADVCPSGCQFNSVQTAIDTFAAGSTIRIGAGNYGRITINKDITLIGAGNIDTVLNGGGAGWVVFVSPGVTATVQDLRITNGRLNPGGGLGAGIANNGTLTLTGCRVDGNTNNDGGGGGGGIFNAAGRTLTMTNCTVTGNTSAAAGGGVFTFGAVTMTGCTITTNRSQSGTAGGIGNGVGGSTTLNGTLVTGNMAAGSPAGLRADPGTTITLTGTTTISGNSPGNCGGGGSFVGGGCAP